MTQQVEGRREPGEKSEWLGEQPRQWMVWGWADFEKEGTGQGDPRH